MSGEDPLALAMIGTAGGLRPGPGVSGQTLEALRFAIAHGLTAGAVAAPVTDATVQAGSVAGVAAPAEDGERAAASAAAGTYFEPDAAAAALADLGVGDRFTVAPAFAGAPGFAPENRNVLNGFAPSIRLGPFVDQLDREMFFDFYEPTARLALHIPGMPLPALVMSSGRLPIRARRPYRIDLEPGTIWILAALFDPAAPSDGYAGFKLLDGSVDLPAAPAVDGSRLTLAEPGEIRLDLALAPAAARSDPVCDHGGIVPPARLGLTLGASAAVTGTDGRCRIGTWDFEVDAAAERIGFDAQWRAIAFPASPDQSRIELRELDHVIARFSGDFGLDRAAWAVPVTSIADPMTLGEADPDASGWLFSLSGDTAISWPGSGPEPVPIRGLSLLVAANRLLLRSTTAIGHAKAVGQDFGLWRLPGAGRPLPVAVRTAAPFELAYSCDAAEGEMLWMGVHAGLALDRPLTAAGGTFPPIEGPGSLLFAHKAGTTRIGLVVGDLPVAGESPHAAWPLALENGFFRVGAPRIAAVSGTLDAPGTVSSGSLVALFEVRGFLPTLPDPYVSNVVPGREFGRRGAGGALAATISWNADGAARLAFSGAVLPAGVERLEPSPPGSRPGPARPSSPARQGGPDSARTGTLAAARSLWDAQADDRAARTWDGNGPLEEALAKSASESGLHLGDGIRLLDVSTRRHQIGVRLAPGLGFNQTEFRPDPLGLDGMRVTTKLAGLGIFMLPQVQWEPVETLDRDQDLSNFGYFPSPLAAADDGGATLIGSRSLGLTPVIPDLALDGLIHAFSEGERVGIVTTLPFGLKAVMALRPGAGGDVLARNEAAFAGAVTLRNALQLSVCAGGGGAAPGGESPALAGIAAQLLNGVDPATGSPQGLSVLGSPADPSDSVEAMFNNEFAAASPRVPVTRLDLSGYGASCFSDWASPFAAFGEASKVRFQILVGRTALEIVKFNSVLYPWGIKVTRMVTVERRGGGGVIRRDSGWQAGSDGLFDFRFRDRVTKILRGSPFVVHPGIFRGLFAVANIRPAPPAAPIVYPSSAGGLVELLPYHFDCEAAFEDGAEEVRARAEGMLGFLHVRPVGRVLTPVDLAALIEHQSAVGGPVDVEMEVGESGFRTRALRVEIDAAGPVPAPEFVAAVRGAPVFGPSGAWSVIRQPGPGAAAVPDAEPMIDGAPMIREGRIGYPADAPAPARMPRPAAAGPYRFADGRDLFTPDSPARDYGFLQTTPTHAFLFRRPTIVPGLARIVSALPPLFADVYARSTAQSLFPPPANAIELADRPYVLEIDRPTGRFRLAPAVALARPRPPLQVGDGARQTMRLVYDEAEVRLAIGETSWAMDMPGLVMWTGLPALPDLVGLRSRLTGSSAGRSQIAEIDTLIEPTLETMLGFVPGMSPRDRPAPVDLAATNLHLAGEITTRFFVEREFFHGVIAFDAFGALTLGGASSEVPGHSDEFDIGYVIGIGVQGRIPLGGIFFLVLGLDFEVGLRIAIGRAGGSALMEIRVYWGIGFGQMTDVLKLWGFIASGLLVELDSEGWHFGGVGMVEAEAEVIMLIHVTISGEVSALFRTEHGRSITRYAGELAINVQLCSFLSLQMTWALVHEDRMPAPMAPHPMGP